MRTLYNVHTLTIHNFIVDIIVRKEKSSGNFVEPFVGFENYILGDVKRPFYTDKYQWYVFVVLTPNTTLRDTSLPLGIMVMKERQLKIIGYTPVFVRKKK